MFEIKRYSEADKEVWNAHVEQARNATFLLNRSYMDYHSDRFHDHSLMIFRNGKLYALLPANEDGDIFYSHQGLTYAGLLTTEHASTDNICQVFVAINTYLKQAGFRKCACQKVCSKQAGDRTGHRPASGRGKSDPLGCKGLCPGPSGEGTEEPRF